MGLITKTLVALIAIEHIYILYMEMFAWETLGKKTFRGAFPDELFKPTKTLAANQGLYNGFLAIGLIYAMLFNNINTVMLFLIFVTLAGIYGSYSTKKIRLFYVQSVPAIIAILLLK